MTNVQVVQQKISLSLMDPQTYDGISWFATF